MAATHFHSTLPLVDDPDSTGVVSDALDTTGLMTLGSGQGAQVTTRENASAAAERARGAKERRHEQRRLTGDNRPAVARHEEKKVKKSPVAIVALIVAALAVAGVLIFVFSKCAGSVAENPSALSLLTTTTSLEADTGLTIDYDGATYEFRESGGAWQLVSPSAGDEVLIELDGTPVHLVIYNDTIYVPENHDDGTWDVMARVIGEGAVAVHVPDMSGEGVITGAKLDGSELVVTCEDGQSVRLPLE